MNRVDLIGRLTKDPELRYTSQGTPVANYTIAINTRYGEIQETDYIDIKSWGKAGEFINKYFKKGQAIALTGRLKNNNYKDNNGINHYRIEVITESIEFVGSKSSDSNEQEEVYTYTPTYEIDEDELPF